MLGVFFCGNGCGGLDCKQMNGNDCGGFVSVMKSGVGGVVDCNYHDSGDTRYFKSVCK